MLLSTGRSRSPSLMMAGTPVLFILAAVMLHSVTCVPLLSLMETTPRVSQFTRILIDSGMGSQMNTTGTCSTIRCFLVFAPSNDAMTAAFQSNPLLSTMDKAAVSRHHYLTIFSGSSKGFLNAWSDLGPGLGTDIGYGKVQILKTGDSTLFWLAKQQSGSTWSYRINNAAIIVAESNREADNGVFHVLDQVALPIGGKEEFSTFISSPDSTASRQLGISKSLRMFNEWRSRDTKYEYLYSALISNSVYKVRTVFLPSDSAWDRIPASVMQQLNSSLVELRKVFVAHFAPDICVFTGWMTLGTNIAFTTGHADVQTFDTKMYLDSQKKSFVSTGGVVAQFVDKSMDYPIGDTVIHVVDRVLAFAYETLATLAEMNAPAFYNRCMAVASCRALLTSNDSQKTLFAPSDITSLNGVNDSQVEQILKLHFVPRHISRPDMSETDLVTAQDSSGQIRFRIDPDSKLYVEGRLTNQGFVRSELQMYDQPAKNGLFHKVAFPLGQPRQTVQDFINSYHNLTTVKTYMGSNSFLPNLGSSAVKSTVFAPNNAAMSAFSAYKGTLGISYGQLILEDATLRDRVFRRMILPNQMILADVAPPGVNEYATANTAENEKVTLNLKGAAGLSTRTVELTGVNVITNVNLSNGLYQCTNGIVYPTGVVLFRENDIEGFTRSAERTAGSLAAGALMAALLAFVAAVRM